MWCTGLEYDTQQYEGVYKLIYLINFSIFGCFYVKKLAWKNVKDSDFKIKYLSSSHQNNIKFDTLVHNIMPINILYEGVYKLIDCKSFCILECVFFTPPPVPIKLFWPLP